MYLYIIEEHTMSVPVQWRLLSNEHYPVGSPIPLYEDVIERGENGEVRWQGLPIAVHETPIYVHGTITGEKESVREGSVIDGATVVKIDKDSVEFEQDGTTWTQDVDKPYPPKWKPEPLQSRSPHR